MGCESDLSIKIYQIRGLTPNAWEIDVCMSKITE